MRDLILAPLIAALCIVALRRPWIGIIGWTWISLMNPHALSWNLNTLPVAAAMAGCTLIGAMFTNDKRDFSITPETAVLIAFMCWMCITLPFSFSVDDSFPMWSRVMKIDFMVLLSLVLLHTKKHLMSFVWIVVAAIGFYGVKGGVFTIATGGSYRVWGPPGTYIDGNNELALALVVITPLFRFLQLQVSSRWGKRAIVCCMLLCVAAALGSHSRGALVALAAMGGALWWFGGRQFGILLGILITAAAAFMLMPEDWTSRMNSISDYQDDGSAMGRLNSWMMAWNLASDRLLGGGYEIYNELVFGMYAPEPTRVLAAHSIYFQVLGEHGFIGLFLFLSLWLVVWWQAGKLRKQASNRVETKWIADLGAMCQVSIIGYAVGGAFLSLAYFDLPYDILIIVVLARRWLQSEGQRADAQIPAGAALAGTDKEQQTR